jgi:hypothetical protein
VRTDLIEILGGHVMDVALDGEYLTGTCVTIPGFKVIGKDRASLIRKAERHGRAMLNLASAMLRAGQAPTRSAARISIAAAPVLWRRLGEARARHCLPACAA